MKHIHDIELLDHLAGKTPDSRGSTIQSHLAECGECRERYAQYQKTWEDLAVLDAGLKEGQFSGGQAVRNPGDVLFRESAGVRKRLGWAVFRNAAAILMAVMLGYFLGKWSHKKSATDLSASTLHTIHIEELAPISPTGLAQSFLDSLEPEKGVKTP